MNKQPDRKCARTECGKKLPKRPKGAGRIRHYCSVECRQIVSLIRRAQ